MKKRNGIRGAAPGRHRAPQLFPAPAPQPPENPEPNAAPALDAAQVVEGERQRVLRELPLMIAAMIDAAKEGSCPHAKFLVEFAGLESPRAPAEPCTNHPSLAELLKQELDDDWNEEEATPSGQAQATS